MAAWNKSEFFWAIPKLLVTFESTFRVLTIYNMLLNQSCITVIAMCSVIDDPPLHKILESIHDSCDLLLDSAIYTRRTRWWKGSPDYFFLQFISPSPVVEINLFFNLQHLSGSLRALWDFCGLMKGVKTRQQCSSQKQSWKGTRRPLNNRCNISQNRFKNTSQESIPWKKF